MMKKSRELCKREWVEWAIKNGINLTREEVEAAVQKYNGIVSQSAPFNGGSRLEPNNTGRMTKWRTDGIYFPRDLNIHDPDHKYKWAEAEAKAPKWVWVMRAAGTLGAVVGIYCLTLLTFLF
jgi:hypothetical protein